jgi:PAS domain S-box-containing protein
LIGILFHITLRLAKPVQSDNKRGSVNADNDRSDRTPTFFSGGGELGALMRAKDWSQTSLGPAVFWPQSLQTCVRIVLTSRQPMFVWWGEELINLYNDAYKTIVGGKHPAALGQPASLVWREIWDQVGPRAEYAMQRNEGTYDEALLLIMERYGYREETYYTFSYSPVPNDEGGIGGIICANTDDTQRIIGERQLALLRDLAAGTTDARSIEDACRLGAASLATNPRDLPFALIYLIDPDRRRATLAGRSGIAAGPMAPEEIALDEPGVWPLARALASAEPHLVDLTATPLVLPDNAWDLLPRHAVLLPIAPQGQTGRGGVLVAGLNPYRLFDDAYRRLLSLVAGQLAAAIANAQAYEEERRRAEALSEIDRAKTAFFSNASHEFRTPLTLMLSPLEDMLMRYPTAQTVLSERREIELIHRNGLRLLKLVNTLLDFSRIEAGRVQAVYEPVDLAALTVDLASAFRSTMEKAGLRYTVDCPPLAEAVYVDCDMWEKIVLNLVSDAFKYTLEGAVTVALRPAAGGGHVELTVRDTGVGIPTHELPRLFERFHRIEGQRGRTQEGTGIGLALVQELVRLHGGTVSAESEVGRGTCFTVSIPTGTAHLPPDRIQAARLLPSTGIQAGAFVEEALRWLPGEAETNDLTVETDLPHAPGALASPEDPAIVLLADDNADMRDYVRRLLGGHYLVEAVPDGLAALEAARRRRPDLVLTDIMMPRLDGFGLLKALKADARLRDVPVILLSARAGEEASVEGLEAGADDYLVKPFNAREMLARVRGNLDLARERRRTREALQRLNEALALQVVERTADRNRLWQLSADIMLVAQFDGVINSVNPAWTAVLGWTETDLIGRSLFDFVHPDDLEMTREGTRTLAAGGALARFDNRYWHKDGSHRWISWSAAPGDGLIMAVGRDITLERQQAEALRRSEEQLRQSQKMEAIGQLTGGVAHDFNNMMQVVLGNLDAVRRRMPDPNVASGIGDIRRYVESALRGVERAASLTRQLLAFSRRQPLDPRPTNIGKLVIGMSDLLRRTLGETISIETVSAGGLWQVSVDANQLESAILNLAVNARDAMPDGGRLTIETTNAYLDETYATLHDSVTPGQYVLISVSDNGTGMSKDVLEKAFEPFFTTKDIGQGTGLGLSQVYGFVKQSGGHAKIYSELGEGTTVKLYLPRLFEEETSVDAGQSAIQVPRSRSGELVLVVEDDEDVRSATTEMLRELGYSVLTAADGAAGLRVLRERPDIRLLFTDVGLPGGMNGRQLTDAARQLRPTLPVLFTTGYARNAIVHHGRLDPGVDLLVKPFTYTDLAAKLRRMIDPIRHGRA